VKEGKKEGSITAPMTILGVTPFLYSLSSDGTQARRERSKGKKGRSGAQASACSGVAGHIRIGPRNSFMTEIAVKRKAGEKKEKVQRTWGRTAIVLRWCFPAIGHSYLASINGLADNMTGPQIQPQFAVPFAARSGHRTIFYMRRPCAADTEKKARRALAFGTIH